ncbi:4Fe-4S binding protein [Engelhardtia mirabilis]|uniref:Electron transport protein YccM n=1 Tax=Engelhardtia mirabilis TaxID=2528011 RepID=A0A518BHQ6_9BACT|nr:Putative electron transport protein YccM [Planctomycetes bacterium Pla133]QDV00846.1 Putative electron transport protein YccM [Planctomycetes bacterium Pla86]
MTVAHSPPRRGSPAARGFDLLRVPLLGPFLRWRHARLCLQVPLLLLAAVLVLHGLFGPQLAPKNLATLLVWVHWRGLLVIALLAVGNVFCMGCPLVLPRELARRISAPTRRLPRALRRKWLGLGLLVAVLFTYEWLDLWASPAATAILILVYFATALLVDALFKGAPFCKWICPIGQFNFVASTLSPFEVKIRERSTCDSCATKDCIRGTRAPEAPARVTQRGCELALFLPEKVGNIDCTFCLDCVHACPQDNVAIGSRLPADELAVDPVRSGIGRISRRNDLAALVVLFSFGALLNAFGMVSPVYAFQRWLAESLGTQSEFLVLAILFALGLALVPALAIGLVTWTVRLGTGTSALAHARRFSYCLAPLGFGVWLAHYSFHFLTGLWTFVPVTQLALERLGVGLLGGPKWGLGGLTDTQVWPIEIGFLALGGAGSLALAWRLAQRDFGRLAPRAFLPWAALLLALAGTALWLLAQPMEMRGTYL